MILEVNNLKKVYGKKNEVQTSALKDINFSVNKGEFIGIMGESGSGKSTLLNIIATLDKASSGQVFINGKNLSNIKDSEISKFRREELGFVFQDFNLLDTFNNRDNIILPLVLSEIPKNEMKKRLEKLAPILGISELLDKYPSEISGGQKQRVAIARALITEPSLLLADEPTGALDSKSAETILTLFKKINSLDQTILMVTHSVKAASKTSRVLFIKDGIIFHELYRGNMSDLEFSEKITDAQSLVLREGARNEK